jgi:hypothetical protein
MLKVWPMNDLKVPSRSGTGFDVVNFSWTVKADIMLTFIFALESHQGKGKAFAERHLSDWIRKLLVR